MLIVYVLQAIVDLIAAEERGYVDICSLLLNRGTIYRMLGQYPDRIMFFLLLYPKLLIENLSGQSNNAADDFSRALTLVEKDDKVRLLHVSYSLLS